jgi:hypothetical protein
MYSRNAQGGGVSESTKRFAESFISLTVILAVSIAGATLVFSLFATDEAPPPPQHRLTEVSMSRRPFWTPSEFGTIFLKGTNEIADSSWLLTAVGSSTGISFRQAAVVILQLIGNRPSLPDAAEYPVDESTVVCLEVNASAFTVSGPEDACSRLAILPRSWAWTLIPKEGISGDQTVAISMVLESAHQELIGHRDGALPPGITSLAICR